MRILRPLLLRIDSISKYSGIYVALVILAVFLLIFVEVISRYALDAPSVWRNTLAQFLFGAYFVLGGAYTHLFGGHVKVDILYDLFPARKRAIVDVATSVVFFIFTIVLLWYSIDKCWTATMRNELLEEAWRVPEWPFMWTLPVATFLLLLQGLAKFIRDLHHSITGRLLQ